MAGFGDQAFAGQFRDLVTRIARRVVQDERPDIRLGKVYSYSPETQFARVIFAGDLVEDAVKVRVAQNMRPTMTMEMQFANLGYDAPGDVVRVWGKPGAWFILDYYAGNPSPKAPSFSVVDNPDFDGTWTLQGRSVADYTLFPPGWSNFWQNNTAITNTQDNEDKVSGAGALRVYRPAGSGVNCRVHGNTIFAVNPGDTVNFSVYAKCDSVAGYLAMGLLTAPTSPGAEFFSGTCQYQERVINLTTTYRKVTLSYVVPFGHYFARFSLLPDTLSTTIPMNFWLDYSESSVTLQSGGQPASTGEIKMWPTVTPPTGSLLCDGSVYSNATYPALAALLGNTFGGTPGSTFGVPDMRGRLPLGASSTISLNSNEGVAEASRNLSHTHTITHTHTIASHNHTISPASMPTASNTTTGGAANRLTGGDTHDHGGNTGGSGTLTTGASSAASSGNQPNTGTNSIPYLGINFIIKT